MPKDEKIVTDQEIIAIRKKMLAASKYPFRWSLGRVSIKKMVSYLRAVHPELIIDLDNWRTSKDTKVSGRRFRIPGSREYNGYYLRVWTSKEKQKGWAGRYGNLIDHNTTDTYRQNWEVARAIIEYEERKSGWTIEKIDTFEELVGANNEN